MLEIVECFLEKFLLMTLDLPLRLSMLMSSDTLLVSLRLDMFFFFFLSQQFITWGTMAVHAYRRNYVWSINTLTFFYAVTQHKGLLRN